MKGNMISEIRDRAAVSLADQRDQIIIDAINQRIGSQWNLAELTEGEIPRLLVVRKSRSETFYLDGQPVVEFYPVKPTEGRSNESPYLRIDQAYKVFS